MFGIVKNIAKHSLIYGAADFISRGIGFFMIPLYTHYLSPADYGTLEILDLISYVISLFLAMGIAQSMFRFYYEYEDKETRAKVISVSLITLWVVTLTVLAILLLSSRQISILVFKSPDYYRMLYVVFITLVMHLSNEIPSGLLRIEQRSVLYVTVNLIKLVLALTLNIVLLAKFHMGIMGILISGLVVAMLNCTFLLIYTLRKIKLTYSFKILKELLRYGIPIMWSWFGMFILHFGDRFILQRLMSLSDVGIYSLAYKFGYMPNFLILYPFQMIWSPRQFDLMKEPDAPKIYSTIFTYFMFAQIFAGLGVLVMIKDVIITIADPQFHEAYKYVVSILLGYIAYGIFQYMQLGILVHKKTRIIAILTLLAAALNVGCNFVLVPAIGIWGAALATFISWAFLAVCVYFPAQRLYHIPFDFIRIGKMVMTAAVIYAIAGLVNPTNIIISMILKFALACTFPIALYLIRFYNKQELSKIKEVIGQLKVAIKEKYAAIFLGEV